MRDDLPYSKAATCSIVGISSRIWPRAWGGSRCRAMLAEEGLLAADVGGKPSRAQPHRL